MGPSYTANRLPGSGGACASRRVREKLRHARFEYMLVVVLRLERGLCFALFFLFVSPPPSRMPTM